MIIFVIPYNTQIFRTPIGLALCINYSVAILNIATRYIIFIYAILFFDFTIKIEYGVTLKQAFAAVAVIRIFGYCAFFCIKYKIKIISVYLLSPRNIPHTVIDINITAIRRSVSIRQGNSELLQICI